MKAIDLFCGFGGLSLGATRAGVEVIHAIDSSDTAVQVHALNHKNTHHEVADLKEKDFTSLPAYDILLASPPCPGHSKATTRRTEEHVAQRELAYLVTDAVRLTEPKYVLVENVPDFQSWDSYHHWLSLFKSTGYHIHTQILHAARLRVPQRRQRLFIFATKAKQLRPVKHLFKERPIGPELLLEQGVWKETSQATEVTKERIRLTQHKFGPTFLIQHVQSLLGMPLWEPIRTITCQDHWAVVHNNLYRHMLIEEISRAQGFPDRYYFGPLTRRDVIRGIGNAVPPAVARKAVAHLLD